MAAAAGGDEEAPPSPNSGRLKLLCSYGGKILPRPLDGQLKYVGGETRVLAVPRSVSFAELKGRIGSMFEAREVAVKYQLAPEELDVLVSVTCDEDLAHMLDEYDRSCCSSSPSASPRFRLFLFPLPLPSSNRHVDGPAAATLLPLSSPPSAGNSPTSSSAVRCGAGRGMHRVRSTPNLGGSGSGSGNVGGFGGFGGGAQRYDVCRCGCGCRVAWGPQQPPTPRGHYALGTGGGGGCACVGHVDDGAHLPPRSGPSAVPTRKMTIWE
ncbi:hypothetical protein ACMD2_01334 [Ananas comosus]|uniref:PB1 domain-containing protein n=1 Tax=Ananas comosus TaxID=4615 RepID=A0A199VFC1_ANACO|nr:hypothetical protein ACMD2_01334 [Ananas comosus]